MSEHGHGHNLEKKWTNCNVYEVDSSIDKAKEMKNSNEDGRDNTSCLCGVEKEFDNAQPYLEDTDMHVHELIGNESNALSDTSGVDTICGCTTEINSEITSVQQAVSAILNEYRIMLQEHSNVCDKTGQVMKEPEISIRENRQYQSDEVISDKCVCAKSYDNSVSGHEIKVLNGEIHDNRDISNNKILSSQERMKLGHTEITNNTTTEKRNIVTTEPKQKRRKVEMKLTKEQEKELQRNIEQYKLMVKGDLQLSKRKAKSTATKHTWQELRKIVCLQ